MERFLDPKAPISGHTGCFSLTEDPMTRSDCPTSMCVFSERIRCDEDCERRRRSVGGFVEGKVLQKEQLQICLVIFVRI